MERKNKIKEKIQITKYSFFFIYLTFFMDIHIQSSLSAVELAAASSLLCCDATGHSEPFDNTPLIENVFLPYLTQLFVVWFLF